MMSKVGPRAARGVPRSEVQFLGSLLLCCLFAGAPAAAAAGGGTRDCSAGCVMAVEVVCGADKVSYMNPCIAECSGKQTRHRQGYCPGDKVRFRLEPGMGSSAKEAAPAVSLAAMRKFAGEGFALLGHAPLSRAPLRLKLPLWLQNATRGGARAAATAQAAKEAAVAGAAGEAPASKAQTGNGVNDAFDGIVTYSLPPGGSAPSQVVKVEILRGDPVGNIYYKSYMYDPDASSVYAYPPQFPSGVQVDNGRMSYGQEAAVVRTPPPGSAPPPPQQNQQQQGPSALARAQPAVAAASPVKLRSPGTASGFASAASIAGPPRKLEGWVLESGPSGAKTGGASKDAGSGASGGGGDVPCSGSSTTGSSCAGGSGTSPGPSSMAKASASSPATAASTSAPAPSAPQSSSVPKVQPQAASAGAKASAKPNNAAAAGTSPTVSRLASGASAAAPAAAAAPKPVGMLAGGAKLGASVGTTPKPPTWVPVTAPTVPSPGLARPSGRRLAGLRSGGGGGDQRGSELHRQLSVIGKDERVACPVNQYPFKAMGQLEATADDGTFMCSGALIAPDRVLTAAHCVWDDRQARSFFDKLAYHPAQYKSPSGHIETPMGRVDWDHVTTFKAYVDDPDLPPGLHYDIAVIKLVKPIGVKFGWLGIRAERPPCGSGEQVTMTLAGYPGDDPFSTADDYFFGGCFLDTCRVNLTCAAPMTDHDCDSYIGQSGAPMYDKAYYVRMVHTLGVLSGITTANSGVTITKWILDQLMVEWVKTAGFTPVPRGGGAAAAPTPAAGRRR